MSAKLVFVKRTQEEINVFGGEVYADVDGRNVAVIGTESVTVEVPAGTHKIKMYKSHAYGSMIGFAENELTLEEGETLAIKYSAPMVVTQPGHMTVSDFVSHEEIETKVQVQAQTIVQEIQRTEEQTKKQEAANSKAGLIIGLSVGGSVFLITLFSILFWVFWMMKF